MNSNLCFMLSRIVSQIVLPSLLMVIVLSGLVMGLFAALPQVASALVPDLPPPILRTCDVTASAPQVQAGTNVVISWTTQGFDRVTLNGQVMDSVNGSYTFTNIQEDTTYTLVASTADGANNCVVSVTVYCIVPPPLPTCTLTPATATVTQGESVTLAWTTQNAQSATLTSFGTVPLSGSRDTGALLATTTYTLTATAADGTTVDCRSIIIVQQPPTPDVCELELTKTVSAATAKPGDTLTYTITIKNTGTGNCTGSGVKIVDAHDAQLTFVSATQSNNILPGYVDIPLYTKSTRTITWNGDILTPGETGTVTFTATVRSLTCNTTKIVKNAAKATALELNNYATWVWSNQVETLVTAAACPVPPPTCTLTPVTATIDSGETVNLVWTTTNASTTSLTDFGAVPLNGNRTTDPLTASKTYTLSVLGSNGTTVSCQSAITVVDTPPASTCDAFAASPTTIERGATSTLSWSTSNATRVVIDNGIGEVALDGTYAVGPLATTTYKLTAYGANASEASCQTTVVVTPPPVVLVPECLAISASPATLPVGGGITTLSWTTQNGISASLSPTLGAVALNGSATTSIATTTTFTLTVLGTNGQSDSCAVTVPVTTTPPAPLTCAANVTLSANPTRIDRGDSSVITWSTTDVDTVRFDQGISSTALAGSVSVSPSVSTTYALIATRGSESVSCPVGVSVTTGGGGGGSVSPSCELTISKNKIRSGETVTLRWDSNRATDLVLKDSTGKTLVTTEDKLARDKDEWFDGSLRVSPTKDTTYTLTVERGSRDRVCRVSVDVEDSIVVTEVRDQQPLITGIALTQVPYTGFSAGPILTFSFYALLMAWALYLAYVLVIKRDVIGGYALAGGANDSSPVATVAQAQPYVSPAATALAEHIRPDVFVASVRAPEVPPSVHAPVNLPTAPVIGYAQSSETVTTTEATSPVSTDEMVTALENHAHAKKALLSSDAIRHLMGVVHDLDGAIATLNDVITEAKAKYPSEDGWVVINEKRMRDLCLVCQAKPAPSSAAPYIPTVIPEGAGSLAEAIVTGNVVAAYELIGHRPMFALADAAADLDALYRGRKTGADIGSELLRTEAAKLSDEQILKMIEALTGALDGVYTDEASAVKMAIMKAVKVAA